MLKLLRVILLCGIMMHGQVLGRCRESDLKLKREKCHFRVFEVLYSKNS